MFLANCRVVLSQMGEDRIFVEEIAIRDRERNDSFINTLQLSNTTSDFRYSAPGKYLTEDYQRKIRHFFVNEPCLYNHAVFSKAAVLFEAMQHPPEAFLPPALRAAAIAAKRNASKREKLKVTAEPNQPSSRRNSGASSKLLQLPKLPGSKPSSSPKSSASTFRFLMSSRKRLQGADVVIPEVEFESENEKRLTYQLVFQTLKYQKFLIDMLQDTNFVSLYPQFEDDLEMIMVILCDFKQRKFQRRLLKPGESLNPKLSQIEDALFRTKIRLDAALARSRIKSQVLSIDWLLPDTVRKNERIGANMHVTCWINNLKCSKFFILNELSNAGFRTVTSETELVDKTFMVDADFDDILLFPNDLMSYMEHHQMVTQGMLVMQDKSSSVAAHSIKRMMSEDDDVLHVNLGSGLTSAHLASLTHRTNSTIYATGIDSDRQLKNVLRNLERLGARNRVKVITGDFLGITPKDSRVRDLKLVLVTALCSKSGIANPVNFVVTEGEDLTLLRDLSLGHTDHTKIIELVQQHQAVLRHVLQFPRVQGVVYITRSLIESENENVVTAAIEYAASIQQTKQPFRISPPLLPMSEEDIASENPLCGKFLKYMPSKAMSGCFIATITREAEDPKLAAKDIIARAQARGVIAGIKQQLAVAHVDIPVVRSKKKQKKPKMKEKKNAKKAQKVENLEEVI